MAGLVLSLILFGGVSAGGERGVQVLYFTATWCEYCDDMQPSLESLQQDGWSVQQIDIDQKPNVVEQFQLKSLPTVVLVSGQQEVDRLVGVTSHADLSKRLLRAAARAGFNAQAAPRSAPTTLATHTVSPESANSPPNGMILRRQSPRILPGLASLNSRVADVRPSVRAQEMSPEITTPQGGMQRASRATGRIRVDEGQTVGHGTGTIIDVHNGEALVLTCGHLFREMQQKTELSVDLLAGTPQEQNVPARLIDFKADEEDIGLVSLRLPIDIDPVEVLPRGKTLNVGQPVYSFGCDHGQDPTRRDTRITHINRYVGAANVEISGAPAVGRSGGGLFDMQGRLIGVCNAADSQDDEGIYASADVIYDQIQRLGLSHLFTDHPVEPPTSATEESGAPLLADSMDLMPQSVLEQSRWNETPAAPDPEAATAQEVICIVKDAAGQSRMVTIHAPTADLLQAIQDANAGN